MNTFLAHHRSRGTVSNFLENNCSLHRALAPPATRFLALIAVAMLLIFARINAGAQTTQTKDPAPKAGASPAGNIQNGKRIYTAYGCYQCHGGEGQGSMQTGGSRIGPPLMQLPGFAAYIRQPAGQMPPYTSKAVSDSELADIYAFLQSRPVPPPAKSIPLLNN
jgi:mono/diheme cytochrome c family protein